MTRVSLLTGCGDKPYAVGLGSTLMAQRVGVDLIGGDDLDCPEFRESDCLRFFNLRGSQRSDVSAATKMLRVGAYYVRLIRYALTAEPKVFHILWNNKFETVDRTALMLYYKALRKKIVLTVHNVNAGKRDLNDSLLNRLTLRVQYRLADHIFVHTSSMKAEMIADFGVAESAITVIPFGVNQTVPDTALTPREARLRLGIAPAEKTLLFFGNIAPYKGLEYLVAALPRLARPAEYRLLVAGTPKSGGEKYWQQVQEAIDADTSGAAILQKIEFVPDEDTELYFKAADVLVLPYKYIFQSGVLFLAYNFGLPVLAADVGSLKDDVVEGHTGFMFKSEDPMDLARAIEAYFSSELFTELSTRRQRIRDYANDRHSWAKVGVMTQEIYADLLGRHSTLEAAPNRYREDTH